MNANKRKKKRRRQLVINGDRNMQGRRQTEHDSGVPWCIGGNDVYIFLISISFECDISCLVRWHNSCARTIPD